ncbi:MAG: protease modulator HflC [Candidatus Poribacteria bacterium]|nr:protease modulator HflC [Candidatus Poribacteria bacterium]
MNAKILIPLIIIVVIAIVIGPSMLYIVREGEQAVITEFGRPIGEPIDSAGLKIKTPFIQKVHRFEKRILEWDASPNQITTKDKRFIWLDTSARWRIKDALKFYQALGTETDAQSRLDDIIDSAARDLVTGQLLVEVVRDSNRIIDLNLEGLEAEEGGGSAEPLERINVGRGQVAQMILEKAQQSLPEKFGIELIDVRIKRINYVKEVQQKVFARMISERQRIAAKYRSEGEGEAADIKGQKQKELERIQSEAYKQAEQIRGNADAEAIKIYAQAHGRDSEFYAFLQTLQTYRATTTENTKLILSTDSDLYRYLKKSGILNRR